MTSLYEKNRSQRTLNITFFKMWTAGEIRWLEGLFRDADVVQHNCYTGCDNVKVLNFCYFIPQTTTWLVKQGDATCV